VAAGGDEVFRQLVLARIIESTSKADSLRVLAEVGVAAASYPTLNRRLPGYATDTWRQGWPRPRRPCGAGLDLAGHGRRVDPVLRDRRR
jgi:hypothetical protein